jgi:hypothetical protein
MELWRLHTDVVLHVQEALVMQTTFSEFVWNTRWLGEDRTFALKAWLREQEVGKPLHVFEGSEEELKVVRDHVEGMRTIHADV